MTFLIQQTLIYAVPLMIVALAGVFAERSGIINLALEGIMIFGAFIGVLFVRLMQGSAAVLAIQAGNDMIVTTDYQTQIPQVIAAVQSGAVDAIIAGMSPTAEREEQVDFTDCYYNSNLVVIIKK